MRVLVHRPMFTLPVLALLLLGLGCATTRPAPIAGGDGGKADADPWTELRTGDEVRVVLQSGEVVAGDVILLRVDEIVVLMPESRNRETRTIARSDIASLEIRRESGDDGAVGAQFLLLVIGVTAFVAAIAVSSFSTWEGL